jgi:hypothetical protein
MMVWTEGKELGPFLLNFMHPDEANREFMHQARCGSGRGEGEDHGGEGSGLFVMRGFRLNWPEDNAEMILQTKARLISAEILPFT